MNYGGIRLKNRIIFAPTTLGLKGDAYQAKLQEIARGGCAMIILGDVPVGKHGFGQSLFTAKGFAAYQRITETIHREGCLVCAQLHQSDSNLKGMLKYIPGVLTKRISMEDLRPLLNEQVSPYITGLPEKKVRQITASFGPAAVQAQPDVRQLCLAFVQPPHGCLRRLRGKPHPLCGGGRTGRAPGIAGHAH